MLIKAHGKINLSLDITGRREDGYHYISSVMQSVALHDDIVISKRSDGVINIETDHPDLNEPQKNIAYKACHQMMIDHNISCGFDISIAKRIPIAAGMAGGSANAAAVIRGINDLCGLKLSINSLSQTGVKIGADVPFCIRETPSLATGIGELLKPVKGLPENIWILLVNPGIQISTKKIYEAIDSYASYENVNTSALISALQNNDLKTAVQYMENVMEPVTKTLCPKVSEIIKTLQENGATHAMMTGSGATCFGLFESDLDEKFFKRIFPDYFVCATTPYSG